jgi:hypothetical protein
VVIAYLMWRNAWDFPTALDAVRASRPRASPNAGFEYQLRLLHQAAFDTASWPGWDGEALAACQLQASAAAAQQPAGEPWQLHHPYQEVCQQQQVEQQLEQQQQVELGEQPAPTHTAHLEQQEQQQEQPLQQEEVAHVPHGSCTAAAGAGSPGATAAARPAAAGAGAGAKAGCGHLASCCIM